MTETKTVCDRCGKVVKRFPRQILYIVKNDNTDGSVFKETIDVCADCEEDFKRWLERKRMNNHED